MKLAVVGGGWAGLAAAVRALQAGHEVTVFEMAGHWGGRARGVELGGHALDNGQHILIGAYVRTLALLETVGVDQQAGLARLPLTLRYPDGRGLRMPAGPAWLVFAWAVARCVGWTWPDRLALVAASLGWAWRGFRCDASLTVAQLCARLPPRVRALLIDPLCVAALNTAANEASAAVFLRVLKDALFSGRGSADLLLPRRTLSELLPEPAARWLATGGATMQAGRRVGQIQPAGAQWLVDDVPFDVVVLACGAPEAARLTSPWAPGWSGTTNAFSYEPIITVYAKSPGTRLPQPMTALLEGPDAPAQFVFDHGAIGGEEGVFAFVVSGARTWVEYGLEATTRAVLQQAQRDFPPGTWHTPPELLQALAERRATFRCVPGLNRPTMLIGPGLVAAGDYVEGPYPATLEGAVRSGEAAVAALLRRR